jgi:hypothetical protein
MSRANIHILRRVLCFFVVTCSLVAVGCGRAPEIAKVVGTVTFRGKPVEGANVTFFPDEGSLANAKTDSQGKFELAVCRPGSDVRDGAQVGGHIVTIAKKVPIPAARRPADYRPGGRLSHTVPMEDSLPSQYSSADRSPLKAEVESGKTNEFTFDLVP